jgi:murein peptide amidase A
VTRLPRHRSHDYTHLIRRWKAVASKSGMRMRAFTRAGEWPVFIIEPRRKLNGTPLFYLSSGVHGDEPGSACGLLDWSEENVTLLRERAFLIFPILNPHGLVMNTRVDHRGLDINRRFHLTDDPLCGAWQKEMAGRKLCAALCLHEDYDAEGAYIYELSQRDDTLGPTLLAACAEVMPTDLRRDIDGRGAKAGVIRRKRLPTDLPGLPEAIVLHQMGCPVTLTFETPSEYSLDDRVRAQALFIAASVKELLPA